MKKRGRKSSNDVSTSPVDVRQTRLSPPDGLSAAEREVFLTAVQSCDPSHFSPADAPMLAAYSRAAVLSMNPANFAEWEKSTRALAVLATKLRLTPHSRIDARAAGRKVNNGPVSFYETMEMEDDDD
jgi:hypothetical protein